MVALKRRDLEVKAIKSEARSKLGKTTNGEEIRINFHVYLSFFFIVVTHFIFSF